MKAAGPAGVSASDPAEVAIPRLLELYGPKIRGLALRLCGGPEDADDILQDTFLSAFRHWEQFEGRADSVSSAGVFFFSPDRLRVEVEYEEQGTTVVRLGTLVRVQRMSTETTGYAIEFDPA